MEQSSVWLCFWLCFGFCYFSIHAQQAQITEIIPSFVGDSIGMQITIIGRGMQADDMTQRVRVGDTACSSTNWLSSSSIACRAPKGPGGLTNLPIFATVYDQSTDTRFVIESGVTLSYKSPVITAAIPANGPDSILMLTLRGLEFGSVDGTLRAAVGGTACQLTRWLSNQAALCKRSPAVQKGLPLTLSVLAAAFTLEEGFSADTHAFQRLSPANSMLRGGLPVTVFGSGFGTADLSPRVSVVQPTETIPCDSTRWLSDSAMVCLLPSGNGVGLGVEVAIPSLPDGELLPVAADEVFSYDVAELLGIGPTNLPLVGGLVTFYGINFGTFLAASPRAARVGDTACGEGGAAAWVSDSAIRCKIPLGYSEELSVVLTVNRLERKLRRAATYDTANITAVYPTNGPASGIRDLTVLGSGFGAFQLSPAARLDTMPCKSTRWVADTSLLCSLPTVPPKKFFYGSQASVAAQISRSLLRFPNSFTYDRACIGPCIVGLSCSSSINSLTCDALPDGDFRHSYNDKAVQYDDAIKTTTLAVLRIHGNFTVSGGTLTAGNATINTTSEVTETFSDVSVIIGGIFTCEPLAAAAAAYSAQAVGSGVARPFLTVSAAAAVGVGVTTGAMQSYLDCVLPPGVGGNLKIEVFVKNASHRALLEGCRKVGYVNCFKPSGENTTIAADGGLAFSYSMPLVDRVVPSHVPNLQAQATVVTVYGSNFGAMRALEIYGPKCANSLLPACQQLYNNGVALFPYPCPVVNLLASNGLMGSQLEADISRHVLAYCVSNSSYMLKCQNVTEKSQSLCTERCLYTYQQCGRDCPSTMLICLVGPYGGAHQVTVIQGGFASAKGAPFAYDPPSVFEVFPPEQPIGGSSTITMLGRNFGVQLGEYYLGESSSAPGSYDPFQAPIDRPAILRWVQASTEVCYSSLKLSDVLGANNSRALPVQSPCNLGRTLASEILGFEFGSSEDGMNLEQIRVAPPRSMIPNASLSSTTSPVFVSIGVSLLGQSSSTLLVNSTIAFRPACSRRGDMLTEWYLGAEQVPVISSRANVTLISYPPTHTLYMIGGTTNALPQTDSIYFSPFTGTALWKELLPRRSNPWFAARITPAVCVHRDLLFTMGGMSQDPVMVYNDVWVYAITYSVALSYSPQGTDVTLPDTGWEPLWIKVTTSASWAPRARPVAVSYKGQLILLGGVRNANLQTGFQSTEIWTTYDVKTWNRTAAAPWKNRNSLFAWVHGDRLFAIASVQNQFYVTWYSYDGINWISSFNSCPLVNVEVQAAVYYRGYSLLFTLGCHDHNDPQETAVPCSGTSAGTLERENRIYYTADETTLPWTLALRTFSIDDNLNKIVWEAIPWAAYSDPRSFVPGEYRWGFSVVDFDDVLILFGGQRKISVKDSAGQPVRNTDGSYKFIQEYRNDVWLSKGLLPIQRVCLEKTVFTQSNIYAAMGSQSCAQRGGAII